MELGKKEAAIIFELGHSRINIRGKFEKWNRLWMDRYLSQYSTPEIVCRYRAERITGFKIIEAGSGAGMQSIFLSQTNVSTLSFEVLPDRHRMARLNSEEYKTGKLKFLNGDIYSVSSELEIDSDTLIFSDPARPQVEGERSMESLIPSPESLIRIFGDRSQNFVFDLPPQMKWDNIRIEGEKEYLSVNGNLNRLTLYCGKLRKDETSAVMLPSGTRLSGDPREPVFPENPETGGYLLIPDISIVYAKLIWKLEDNLGIRPAWKDGRRFIYTSDTIQDNFPGEQYAILTKCSHAEVHENLVKNNAGRSFPRFSVDEKEYYGIKKGWEEGLSGNTDIYVFRCENTFFLTEKVNQVA